MDKLTLLRFIINKRSAFCSSTRYKEIFMDKGFFALSFIGLACAAAATHAVTVPYTEDFAANNANWKQNGQTTFATYNFAGGPDGSSYISSTFNFVGSAENDGPVLHRANLSDAASGSNFFGDWIASGGKEFRAFVRHDSPEPLNYFVRFTGAAAFPGVIVSQPTAVQPNTWTPIEFMISPISPNLFFEAGAFADIFANVSRVQFGVSVPPALAGIDQDYTFDLDQVTLDIPEPNALALILMGLTAFSHRKTWGSRIEVSNTLNGC